MSNVESDTNYLVKIEVPQPKACVFIIIVLQHTQEIKNNSDWSKVIIAHI